MQIHPTAIVSPESELGDDVHIGPYAIVEGDTRIGARSQLDAHTQVRKGSIVGEDNKIGSGTIIGADPHFKGFDSGTRTTIEIGDRNVIREYVTIHRSIQEGASTMIGGDNYFMTGSHIGHDCTVGSHNTLANNVLLGGHVELGSNCFLGGASAFHQFVRIGDYALAQGHAGMSLDVPPFTIAAGINHIAGINAVGMKRAGFDSKARKEIKEVFRLLYRSENSINDLLSMAESTCDNPAVKVFLDFLRDKSKKGICSKFGSP